MNLYGYWQYYDVIGLSCGVEKYDLVYVFKAEDGMVLAINEKGREIYFHKTYITKESFERPSYKNHKECELGIRSAKFYKTEQRSERHKNDCHKCQMYKFKQTVKKFKDMRRIKKYSSIK